MIESWAKPKFSQLYLLLEEFARLFHLFFTYLGWNRFSKSLNGWMRKCIQIYTSWESFRQKNIFRFRRKLLFILQLRRIIIFIQNQKHFQKNVAYFPTVGWGLHWNRNSFFFSNRFVGNKWFYQIFLLLASVINLWTEYVCI